MKVDMIKNIAKRETELVEKIDDSGHKIWTNQELIKEWFPYVFWVDGHLGG